MIKTPFNMLNKEARRILNIVQKDGPLTKNEILLMTNMKLTTLNRIMQPLEESRIVVETDVGRSTGGRKPVLYDVNPRRYYLAGIEISRTYSQVIIMNLKMDILFNHQFKMDETCSPDATVKMICNIFDGALTKLSISAGDIIGVGVGAVGPLEKDKGVIINPRDFPAPGWSNVPIKSMLENGLGIEVSIDDGANTAALAEFLYGCGKGFRSVAYFNCGIGIRNGVIASGRIVRAVNNTEDAFGHMTIDIDGDLCSCGNYGCIDCYSSISAIIKKFSSEVKKGRITSLKKPLEDVTYIDICNMAEEDDELAREIITSAAVIFGAGLANYINLLSPNLVILSGPLIKHSQLFYDVCTKTTLKRCYLKGKDTVSFSRGGYLKDSAMAVGAAAEVIWGVLEN